MTTDAAPSEALRASVSPPGGHRETREPLPIAQRGLQGLPVACLSDVVRPGSGIYGRHRFNCAFPTLGGVCDCGAIPVAAWTSVRVPDLFTGSRGFTYDLAAMLGDGYYEESA